MRATQTLEQALARIDTLEARLAELESRFNWSQPGYSPDPDLSAAPKTPQEGDSWECPHSRRTLVFLRGSWLHGEDLKAVQDSLVRDCYPAVLGYVREHEPVPARDMCAALSFTYSSSRVSKAMGNLVRGGRLHKTVLSKTEWLLRIP